jgi:pimeloyl-ACP methyl ester carboxylesterase
VLFRSLARDYHVVAPDMRGHGDSDWVGRGGYYYFFDYVADLDDVIRRTTRKRLVVAGHSMGGSVVSYWAGARAGDPASPQPDGLALFEGLGPPESPAETAGTRLGPWIDQWRRVTQKPRKPMASLDEAVARLRHHDPRISEEMARELAERGTRPVRSGGITWKHDPLHVTAGPLPFRRDVAASLWGRIRCPVLLVEARQSTLHLSAADHADRRTLFTDVRDAVIEDAGHMMLRHQPPEMARLIASLARK